MKLLTLIQELQEYINSEDADIRAKSECYEDKRIMARADNARLAMAYLAEVLAAVPQKVLSLQQSTLPSMSS